MMEVCVCVIVNNGNNQKMKKNNGFEKCRECTVNCINLCMCVFVDRQQKQ